MLNLLQRKKELEQKYAGESTVIVYLEPETNIPKAVKYDSKTAAIMEKVFKQKEVDIRGRFEGVNKTLYDITLRYIDKRRESFPDEVNITDIVDDKILTDIAEKLA